MEKTLRVQKNGTIIINDAVLNTANWTCESPTSTLEAINCTALEAFEKVKQTKSLRHLVIGIIGPRDATGAQLVTAEKIGGLLGPLGFTLICGGKTGVMEAASKGCYEAGGLMIGILPQSVPEDANPYVSIPLPTGLGEARNMIIAKSARVLIAVGGSYGTLSEVAYGLHFSKPVIGVENAADVAGVVHADSPEEAVEMALMALLQSAPIIESNNNV